MITIESLRKMAVEAGHEVESEVHEFISYVENALHDHAPADEADGAESAAQAPVQPADAAEAPAEVYEEVTAVADAALVDAAAVVNTPAKVEVESAPAVAS